jgi:hemoglobin
MRIPNFWKLPLLAAVVLAMSIGSVKAAEPEKIPAPKEDVTKTLDLRIRKGLFNVINNGVDLYDKGDWAGCYHEFDGGLRAVAPLLSHRPDLQKIIADGLKDAESEPRDDKRAWYLRLVLDKVRDELKDEAAAPAPPPPVAKTLWDRLGGENGVEALVKSFLNLAANDKEVDFFRKGKYKLDEAGGKKVIRHMVELISVASGGPLKYTGRDMKEVHKDMAITDAEFTAFVADFKLVLAFAEVKANDIDTLLKAVEATRKDIVSAKPVEAPSVTTMWERMGGEKGVGKIVDDLYKTVTADSKVNFYRKKGVKPTDEEVKALREKMIDYLSSMTGGPRKYEGKSVKAVHAGMEISEEEYDLFAQHFKDVLEHNKVKADDVKILMAAVGELKKQIVEEKKPEEKKPGDKKPDDKKPEDKPATDKKADDKTP